MQPKKKIEGVSAPEKAILGQVVACLVALGIMGFGAWSLLGQNAPYHPEVYDGEVTRGAADLTNTSESN
ncbi:hypothetical protein [Sulfitobacter sp.]|jgi:hypothetical protein|uniref:hypothetical protein n=1 Tax=Sulfitobacter sp. TaxID=1903071 RepID=UPI00306E08B3